MTLFQVSFRTTKDGHRGYAYFTTQIRAQERAKLFLSDHEGEDGAHATVTPVQIEMTKVGICSLLNIYADHPNNG